MTHRSVSAFLLGAGLLLFAIPVQSATRTWTGAASNLWSNAANWAEGVVPVNGDALVFPAGAANLANRNDLAFGRLFQTLTVNDNYTFTGLPFGTTNGI